MRSMFLALLLLAGCGDEPKQEPKVLELEPLPVLRYVPVEPDLTVPALEPTPVCHEDLLWKEREEQSRILKRNHIRFSDSTEGLHFRYVRDDLSTMEFYDHVAYLQSMARESVEQNRCAGLPLSL